MTDPPKLDPVLHQTVRTRLSALLRVRSHSFSELKSALDVTDGNLDAHLRKLSAAGYLHSRTVLKGRPHTVYRLSESGQAAFDDYAAALSMVVERVRQAPDRSAWPSSDP